MKEMAMMGILTFGLLLGLTSSSLAKGKMTVIYSANVKDVKNDGRIELDRGSAYGLRLGMKGYIGDPYEELKPILLICLEDVEKDGAIAVITKKKIDLPIKKGYIALFVCEEEKPAKEMRGEMRVLLRRVLPSKPPYYKVDKKVSGSIVLNDAKTYILMDDTKVRKSFAKYYLCSYPLQKKSFKSAVGNEVQFEPGELICIIPNTPEDFFKYSGSLDEWNFTFEPKSSKAFYSILKKYEERGIPQGLPWPRPPDR